MRKNGGNILRLDPGMIPSAAVYAVKTTQTFGVWEKVKGRPCNQPARGRAVVRVPDEEHLRETHGPERLVPRDVLTSKRGC